MIHFHAAPPVPVDYPRLQLLSADELTQARAYGYVADKVDPAAPATRAGRDITHDPLPGNSLEDWRVRMYVTWFCYIFENFAVIQRPMGAIEELVLEFRASDIIDLPGRRLGTLYAGAGSADPLTESELVKQTEELWPHFLKALARLDGADSEALDVQFGVRSMPPIRIRPSRK